MASQREYFNFRTCCRLCLEESSFSKLNIFSSKNRDDHLAEKINHVIGIQVSAHDPISTNLCSKCFLAIKEFDKFKYQSLINQEKLAGMQSVHDASLFNESIIIKDEPLTDDEDIVFVSSERSANQQLQIKIELTQSSGNLRDDQPPILSPNLPTTVSPFQLHVEEEIETSQEPMDSIQPVILMENDTHQEYNGSTAYQAEEQEDGDATADNENTNEIDNDTEPEPVTRTVNQRDIMDFAAGLQLQSKAVHINMEPMTASELQYISKHEHLYTQYIDLRCCCHNGNTYPSKKSLLFHLQKVAGLYYVPYTCLTCYTTFNGRSPFSLHIAPCKRRDSTNIPYAVANRNERDVNKHRVFQSFLCKLCDGIFRLYDLYVQHADEHVLKDIENPCHCGQLFHNANAYKQHILSSCVIRPMCDICYKYYDTPEEFKAHCTDVHDNDPGPQFTVARGFEPIELPFAAMYACVECNLKCRQEMFIIKHLQLAHNYNPEEAKTVAADCFIGVVENPPEAKKQPPPVPVINTTTPKLNNNNGLELTNGGVECLEQGGEDYGKHLKTLANNRFQCQICTKEFSNRSNVMRHLSQAHFRNRRMRSIRCGDCDQTFSNIEALTVHLDTEHAYSCKDCGLKCKTLNELEKHRTIHLKISLKRDPQTHNYELNDSNNSNLDDMPRLEEAVNPTERKSLRLHCKLCKKLFATPGGLAGHLKKHHPEVALHRDEVNSFPRKCHHCGIVIKNIHSWTMHMKNHTYVNNEGSSSSNSPARPDDTDYFTCRRCFKVFVNKGNLKQHMRSHGVISSPSQKKRFFCSICKFGCSSPQDWSNHKLKHVSKIGKNLLCKYCKVSFENVSALETHMAQEHEEKKPAKLHKSIADKSKSSDIFDCKICGKVLHSLESLRGHIGWHKRPGTRWMQIKEEPPTLTSAEQTDQEVPKVNIALQTSTTKTTNRNYVCISCQHLFPSSVALQIHITKVHGTARCPNCNMYFKTSEILADHVRQYHVKGEPNLSSISPMVKKKSNYEFCKICGQEFDGLNQLRKHMGINHPEIPFIPKGCVVCPYCKRRFLNTCALASHVRKHQRDGDILPRYTPKGKASLTPALKPIKPHPAPTVTATPVSYKYQCAICQQGFDTGSDMRTHIIKAHPF